MKLKLSICLLLPNSKQSIPLRTEVAEVFGKHFSEKKHRVLAIISSNINKNSNWKGIEIYEVGKKRKIYKMLLSQYLIEKKKCNIILARNTSTDGIIGLFLRWRYKIPFIFQYTWPSLEAWREKVKLKNEKKFLPEIIERIEDFLQVSVMRRSDLVLATSPWMKKYLVSKGVPKNKVMPLPNGVNPALFYSSDSSVEIRVKYNLGVSSVITYIGIMDELRQLDFLIYTFKKVKDKIKEVKLIMVGDGNDKNRLEKIVSKLELEKDVIFTGEVPYDEIPKFLSASDVTASPIPVSLLYKVSSPLKVFEYMGAGKPVVANEEIPEQKEAIRKSGGGIVVPYRKDAFADAIIELLRDVNKRKKIGSKGRKWVLENRTYRKLAQELESVFMELLNSKGQFENE